MSLTRSQLEVVAEIHGSLLHIILSTLNRVEAVQRKMLGQDREGTSRTIDDTIAYTRDAAAADALAEILREVEALLDAEVFERLECKMIDGAAVFDYLKSHDLTPCDIRELSKYFNWPDSQYNYIE